MEKFRVISDLHLDINEKYPFIINDDIFTVICGDTAGSPSESINWIKKNIKSGVGVSGNHLPYNDEDKTIQELRDELSEAFPKSSQFTYLDVESKCFKKEVDGILFLGSCFYSNMKIKSNYYPDGDITDNKLASHRHMNDYKWAIVEKRYDFGPDNNPTYIRMTPDNYVKWSNHATEEFDKILNENEQREKPLPVVIITHYPLIKDIVSNSFYVDDDNWASYGNDLEEWIKKHSSIKCLCCGHCHDMSKNFRHFKIKNNYGNDILIINNSRGYVGRCHDATFNPNRFVNVKSWEVEEIPESDEIKKEKEERYNRYIGFASCFF